MLPRYSTFFREDPPASARISFYSLLVTCQRHGKDPMAYMKDILMGLPRMTNQDDLRALTPQMS